MLFEQVDYPLILKTFRTALTSVISNPLSSNTLFIYVFSLSVIPFGGAGNKEETAAT